MLIQYLLILVLIATLVITLKRARQGVVSWGEAALWSVLWIAAGVVILMPEATSVIARLFGVGRGVDLVMYAAVTLLFVLVFKAFLTLDRLERTLTDIVRKDALTDLPKGPKNE